MTVLRGRNGFGRAPLWAAALAWLLAAAMAQAGEPAEEYPNFVVSGFGTLGVVHSSEGDADFNTSWYRPEGAGHTHTWSKEPDTVFGVQLTGNFTPKLSGVVQVVSEHNWDDTYRPHFEWANFKYQFTPDISVSVGRTMIPTFLTSAYRKVGYANPWVRPPLEVYRLMPITNNDGIHISYRSHVGEVTNTLQTSYGRSRVREADGTTDQGRSQFGLYNTTEYGPWTLHASFHRSKLEVPSFGGLFDVFRLFGPEGDRIADQYDCDGKPYLLGTVGASYDPGRWFLMAEWGKETSHCLIGTQTGWYVSGGYRFGDFTPYATYAESRVNTNISDPGMDLAALPPFLAGPAGDMNALLNLMLGSLPEQKSIALGVRWDFAKNAALKLQFDHVRAENGTTPAGLINMQPGFEPGQELNLISATVNFLF